MSFFASYPPQFGNVPTYANLAAFPTASTVANGQLAIALDTGDLYENVSGTWTVLATTSGGADAITSLTGDVTATGPGAAVATVVSVGGSTAASIHTSQLATAAATAIPTASVIAKYDSSSNLNANVLVSTVATGTAPFTVSSTTQVANLNAATAGSATSFSGNLAGDVTGPQGTTVVAFVGGSSAASIHTSQLATAAATATPTASTIAQWDSSSNMSANVLKSTVTTGTAPLTVSSTTRVANLNATTAGTADTVTTNANLTGVITSVGNATSIGSQTGTGTKFVVDTSPTLITPNIGVASATTINKLTITAPATGSTLTISDGKTATINNTLTFNGTDASIVAFGAGGTVIYNGGALGTPSSGTLSNCTTVKGIVTGSAVAAGIIGERILSTFGAGVAVGTSITNMGSITVTAGVWLIFTTFSANTKVGTTYFYGNINATSASISGDVIGQTASYCTVLGTFGVGGTVNLQLAVSVSGSTTYYANALCSQAVNSGDMVGSMLAIRVG